MTWKNFDGTVLETDTGVTYGAMPRYNGTTPTKSSTAQYSYTFTGWSPKVSSVTKNVTYTAQFSKIVNTYTVTWKNFDGTVLETDTGVKSGEVPIYNGDTPTKPCDSSGTYVFTGWSPNVTSTYANSVYVAQFSVGIINGISKITAQYTTYYIQPGQQETPSLYVFPNGAVYSIKSISNNSNIVDIIGQRTIVGKTPGTTKVTIIVNESISTDIDVIVTSDDFIFDDGSSSSKIIKYVGNSKKIIVPQVHNGLPVSSIDKDAFIGNNSKQIEELIIPNTVTELYNKMFENLTSIRKIELPFVGKNGNDSSEFGKLFGYGNDSIPFSLEEVNITNAAVISSDAFKNCSHITTIIIGDTVKEICEGAFSGCSSLVRIRLPFIGNTYLPTFTDTTKSYHSFGYIFGKTPYSNSYAIKGSCVKYQYHPRYHSYEWTSLDKDMYTCYIPNSLKVVYYNLRYSLDWVSVPSINFIIGPLETYYNSDIAGSQLFHANWLKGYLSNNENPIRLIDSNLPEKYKVELGYDPRDNERIILGYNFDDWYSI